MEQGVIRMQESRANAGKQDQTQEAADQAGPAECGGFPQDEETTCWALFSTELSHFSLKGSKYLPQARNDSVVCGRIGQDRLE